MKKILGAFGRKPKPKPEAVPDAPFVPRLEVTTEVTARIEGRRFSISPGHTGGTCSISVKDDDSSRYRSMMMFSAIFVDTADIPELILLLQEAQRVNQPTKSVVTRNIDAVAK